MRATIAVMEQPAPESIWAAYSAAQQTRPVRQLCLEVIDFAGDAAGRAALDLGCGLGRETAALLDAGWRVHAIDSEADTRQRVLGSVPDDQHDHLTVEVADFATITALPPADLIYAGYSLPFTPPAHFPMLWAAIRGCLRPGGWLAVDLFGDRDEWAAEPDRTFLTKDAARALADGLEMVAFREFDEEGPAFTGPKHWHRFELVAHRP